MNKLSDFPIEVLRCMLGAVEEKKNELQKKVAIIERNEDLATLWAKDLASTRKWIDNLETGAVQLATSIVILERQSKVSLN